MLQLNSVQKQNLKCHKYKKIGTSLLEPYLSLLWNKCVDWVPKWLSPNMITLLGITNNAIPVIWSLCVLKFDTSKYVPKYLLIWMSVSLFIYQLLDALDGKQARRINMCSPLGEIFDHGCDALSTLFVTLMAGLAIVPKGIEEMLFLYAMGVFTCSFLFHWQTFVTGSMLFTSLSVTEAQCSVMLICLGPIIINREIYHYQFLGIPIIYLFLIPVIINLIYTVIVMFDRICNNGTGKDGSTIANSSVISPGISPLILLYTAYYIYRHSPSNLVVNDFYIIIIFYGVIFGKLSLKILVSLVTKSLYFPADSCLLFPLCMVINIYIGCPINEFLLLKGLLVISLFDWIKYFVSICLEFSTVLNIPILLCNS